MGYIGSMATTFTLRPYETGDFEAVSTLDRECFPPGIAYTRRLLRSYLRQPGADCLVAQTADAGLAGFIMAEAQGAEAHIVTLDVAESYRRAGTGTLLLVEMERRLAAQGVKRVELETAINNQAGIAFWQRHGYRAVGLLKGYYLDRLDAYYMLKELAST
jgi:ribosomal-protein-alanine N-acetyltransferase